MSYKRLTILLENGEKHIIDGNKIESITIKQPDLVHTFDFKKVVVLQIRNLQLSTEEGEE